ncbi:MAG TPA: CAP domain-containing protein [Ottowia sp.]|uniref:CAP domain-containing protein n=1 Tax=Ottowia sp. TaxID=1898956 RepID=UPI002CFE90DE|nr:CAP domain-containing protein [Ottowia sp.]HMN21042.1 CAP domain-containing protein [Ottowia sp.]
MAALNWSPALATAAQRHSIDMALNNRFDHTGSDGSTVDERIRDAGYSATAWGENIAAGYGTVDKVVAGWLASPGHCKNIMLANYADFGASCVYRSATTYGSYWTTDFGRSTR